MSAYDDVCGCGEWSCRQCFGSDAVPGSHKNAHVPGHGLPPSNEDASRGARGITGQERGA